MNLLEIWPFFNWFQVFLCCVDLNLIVAYAWFIRKMVTIFFLAKHLKMYLSRWIIWEVEVSKIQRFVIDTVLIVVCSSSCHPNAAYAWYCAHDHGVDWLPIECILGRSELEKEKSACSYSDQTWQQREVFYVIKRRKLEDRLDFKHEKSMPEKIGKQYLAELMRKCQRSK